MQSRRRMMATTVAFAALPALAKASAATGPLPVFTCWCGRAFMGGTYNEPPGAPCADCPPAWMFPDAEELAELKAWNLHYRAGGCLLDIDEPPRLAPVEADPAAPHALVIWKRGGAEVEEVRPFGSKARRDGSG